MNDEQMQSLLDMRYRDLELPRPKVQDGVANVMAQVPRTRQQGRWWPLPAFDRPVSTFSGRMLAPAPIPATDGRTSPRGSTVFSAVKFVAAAVIVALFGGFLLAGLFTTQQDDQTAPAAVTESPPPTTTEDLLSGMVAEEVEPGVHRIVNDGVRDLAQPFLRTSSGAAVLVDDAGAVWRSTYIGDDFLRRRYVRIGTEQEVVVGPYDADYADRPFAALAFMAGVDGRLSTAQSDWLDWLDREPNVREDFRLDGDVSIGAQDDGTVWLFESGDGGLVRLSPDGVPENMNWRRVHDGYASDLMVTPDGEVWLLGSPEWGDTSYDALLRFDGSHWEDVPAPDEVLPADAGVRFDVGADGTLWTTADAGSPPHRHLARYDGADWTIFGEAEGVRPWGGQRVGVYGAPIDMLRVAPDGSTWVNVAHPDPGPDDLLCDGLGRFDGLTWASYLPGRCILDYDFAPGGAVWVVAENEGSPDEYTAPDSPVHTYIITPEALAASSPADEG
jgi:hypothetical protein